MTVRRTHAARSLRRNGRAAYGSGTGVAPNAPRVFDRSCVDLFKPKPKPDPPPERSVPSVPVRVVGASPTDPERGAAYEQLMHLHAIASADLMDDEMARAAL